MDAAALRTEAGLEQRTRTVTWEDPMITARAAMTMSGMDLMEALRRGELPPPPVAVLLDMYPVEIAEGRAVFEMNPAEYQFNPIGSVHGGILSTLLDSALGCAVHTALGAGTGYTTLELKVNFLRRVGTETGRIRAEGTVIHLGRTIATAEARITDMAGALIAHATTTCLIMRPEVPR
jgi:uncharacterized protein (TIGR00369 family)